MKKIIFIWLLLLFSIASRANSVFKKDFSDKPLWHLFNQKDSSNYKIKTLKTEINYSQLRFTIVDEKNNPLNAIISLHDVNKKGISGVFTNEDGKIFVMVYDNAIKYIVVGRIGFGNVLIPIEKVNNKITEVRVQLYPFTTIN